MTNFPRSFLFVPGDRIDRFGKAAASGAHKVILDLEDAVDPSRKESARRAIVEWASGPDVLIRINSLGTPWFADDITAAAALPISAIMLPKAELASIAATAGYLRQDQKIIALVETVAGAIGLREIAKHESVARIAFGSLDFALDSGILGEEEELSAVRTQIVLESRYAGLDAPIDSVAVALSDEAELARQVARAKAFGFGGKLCIHPKQIGAVNAGFAPSEQERGWATRIVEAVARAGSDGAVSVDGRMVDRPILERAKAILR
jgi:citrate lyase subunit beta / citryl-CoA lyase